MTLLLTANQHVQVLDKLIEFAKRLNNTATHSAGIEYTSIMSCFFLHQLSSATTLSKLYVDYTSEWFPVTVGYTIVRPMFEIDVNAHYLTLDPIDYSRQYIEFEKVIKFKQMEAIKKNRDSKNESWREGMNLMWEDFWKEKEDDIENCYKKVEKAFCKTNKSGKLQVFNNWTGKSIRQLAVEVDHKEAYEVFYSELSSFTHGDVSLANRFLRLDTKGIRWTMRSNEFDVGNVFRFAATFFTCFLELFGKQFNTWEENDIYKCWKVNNNE